jgi:hypothetical protein
MFGFPGGRQDNRNLLPGHGLRFIRQALGGVGVFVGSGKQDNREVKADPEPLNIYLDLSRLGDEWRLLGRQVTLIPLPAAPTGSA